MNSKVVAAAVVIVAVVCVASVAVLLQSDRVVDGERITHVESSVYGYEENDSGGAVRVSSYDLSFDAEGLSDRQVEVRVSIEGMGDRYDSTTTIEMVDSIRCLTTFDIEDYGYLCTYDGSDGAWYVSCGEVAEPERETVDSTNGYRLAEGEDADILGIMTESVISFYHVILDGPYEIGMDDIFGGGMSEAQKYLIFGIRATSMFEQRSLVLDGGEMRGLYIGTGSATMLTDDISVLDSTDMEDGTVVVRTTQVVGGEQVQRYEWRQYLGGVVQEVRTYDEDMTMLLSAESLVGGFLRTTMEVLSIAWA